MPVFSRFMSVVLLFSGTAWGDVTVMRQMTDAQGKERLSNGGFEQGGEGWQAWDKGFTVVDGGGRQGSRGIHCGAGRSDVQQGAAQAIRLTQPTPQPIVVSGWSRAENVDGTPDGGYSVYVDITYADGTHLWAQTANFAVGTHDWEQRRIVLMPEKAIGELNVLGLFRGHNGEVWFDDFSLLELCDGVTLFDGTLAGDPITPPESQKVSTALDVCARNGLDLSVDRSSGAVGAVGLGRGACPVFVRDVGHRSDFIAPNWQVERPLGGTARMTGELTDLKLKMSVAFEPHDEHIEASGSIQDLSGEDRAVTVYVPFPVGEREHLRWAVDMRREVPAQRVCINAAPTGAGATGTRSMYPLAVLRNDEMAIALATPFDDPRHSRLVYDAGRGLFYAAFDLGLSAATKRAPGAASFRAIIYGCDPVLGFRDALERYYRLYPAQFEKRVPVEGLWMAFTDISTVPSAEDFGFAYQEGGPNPAWDEEHGVLTFPYTEPMTTWLKLAPETPRTYDGAMAHLKTLLDKADDPLHESASIIAGSSIRDGGGRSIVSVVNAPWCDGCVFALNADPALAVAEPAKQNRGEFELKRLEEAVTKQAASVAKDWARHGTGKATTDGAAKAGGKQSLRLEVASGQGEDVSQAVAVGQRAPKPLVVRARVRTANLTGETNADCSVYVDLVQADGTPLYAQAIPIPAGTRDFAAVERRITSSQAFSTAAVHLLLRGAHTGTVWFDEVFLGEEGRDENLLSNGGFETASGGEAVMDGTYIDSYEFWANTMNFARDQFANVDIPLVFDAQSARVGILTVFSTFAFERELAARMHKLGKLTMANGVLNAYDFPAGSLDVLGTETNWMPGGKWQPMTDAELCYRRALAYQKPYCFLMNTHYDNLTPELTERYMQRALAYGMFPGFFSENAATDCYFGNPKWYEPARPLFKKYMPLIRTIARAGWHPVTRAKTGDPAVYIERFGNEKDNDVYFTLLNDSQTPRETDVTFDLNRLRRKPDACKVHELISDSEVTWKTPGSVHVALKPEQAMLLRISGR